jgi:O-antigen ligase
LNNPIFGNGVGSWPIYFDTLDERNYPHNILVEILTEFGLVGFLFFCILLILVFRNIGSFLKSGQFYPAVLIFLLFLNTFINAFVSGDLPDNRVFFTMVGLAGGIIVKGKYES